MGGSFQQLAESFLGTRGTWNVPISGVAAQDNVAGGRVGKAKAPVTEGARKERKRKKKESVVTEGPSARCGGAMFGFKSIQAWSERPAPHQYPLP